MAYSRGRGLGLGKRRGEVGIVVLAREGRRVTQELVRFEEVWELVTRMLVPWVVSLRPSADEIQELVLLVVWPPGIASLLHKELLKARVVNPTNDKIVVLHASLQKLQGSSDRSF